MDDLGDGRDQLVQERGGRHSGHFICQPDKRALRRAVDRDIQVELAFGGSNFCNVDVEVADRVGLELSLWFLVVGHLRQTADIVPLQAAMQG
jgi:hypothetical protein